MVFKWECECKFNVFLLKCFKFGLICWYCCLVKGILGFEVGILNFCIVGFFFVFFIWKVVGLLLRMIYECWFFFIVFSNFFLVKLGFCFLGIIEVGIYLGIK